MYAFVVLGLLGGCVRGESGQFVDVCNRIFKVFVNLNLITQTCMAMRFFGVVVAFQEESLTMNEYSHFGRKGRTS
jgi:hypothetical protein